MKNEMENLRRQVEDLKAEVLRLQQERKASYQRGLSSHQEDKQTAQSQSEEKFQLAFQASPDSINVNRLSNGVYIDVNEGFTKLTGYTREDTIGKSSIDLNIWYDSKDRERLVKALMSDGYVENFEAKFRKKNGQIEIGLMSARILTMNKEEVILSITRDITDRKRTEEALQENLLFLRQTEKIAHIGGWKANIDTDELKWTEGVHQIIEAPLDYKPGLESGLNFYDPEFIPVIKNALTRTLKDGSPFLVQAKLITTNGKRLWVEVRGLQQVVEGGKTSVAGTLQDITERKQTEVALRESEARFRVLVEGAPDAIFVQSAGRFAYLNPAACRLFGASRAEDMLGKDFMEWVAPEYRDKIQERIRFQCETGEPTTPMEQEYLRLDGSRAHVETAAVPIRYQGENAHIVFLRDITERKQAEEALRESKDRFRNLVESAPIGIFTTSSNGKALSINLAMARILDFPSQEEAIKRYTDLSSQLYVHAERRHEFLRLLQEFGRVEDFEYQARTAVGRTIWLSMNARISDPREDGSFIIEGFATDITERKRAEDELRDSEERHRRIVEASSDAILLRSKEIVIYANPAALKLFRANQPGDLIGKRYLDLVHPDDRALSAERVKKNIDENWIASPREHRVLALDGQVVHVESTGVPVKYRGETQVFGVFRDITERRLANEKLRGTEKKYRELAESLPQVIFEIDLNGTLKYLNQTGFRLFGYTPEEISKGFNVLEAFIPENRDRLAIDIMLNVQGERFGRKDYTAVRKDGTKFPVGVHANRVMSGQTAVGVRGILIDLTATRRAEEEKRKLEIQLQQAQKMEAIGALAGGIAHDFNNILSAIIGYTELAMLNEGVSNSENELNQALIAANRAKDLVKQILAFSRQTDEERMPVRVALVAREAVKFLRATIPATIEIKTRLDEKSGAVLANSVELHQIIMNLCTNAQHAIGEQAGLLEVEVQNTEIDLAQKNDVIDLEIGSYVKLSVRDTGYGMVPDTIKRIFDPYFTTKEKGVGTGLGLAVVHGIVKKCGGAIRVESELGKGTTFHIYLPKVDMTASIKAEQPKTIVGGSERILFVDDEKMLVDIGQQALQRLGYDVVSRTSPIEALELFKAKPDFFDLVITDKTMPGMTGDALVKELLSIRPNLPVIICTGYSQTIDHERAKQKGIKAFVMKPLLISEIAAAVRKVLDNE
jgi:PAS domain S-box-containing protein